MRICSLLRRLLVCRSHFLLRRGSGLHVNCHSLPYISSIHTYMDIQLLAISPVSIHIRRDNDELILCDEIPYTALFAGRLVAVMRLDVEFEGGY
jgi:hypothetical protein